MENKNWTDGYSSEVTYTKGYYKTQSPGNIALAVLARGVMPPKLENFRYLELGFGQGLSLNVHAAAYEGEFWGADFNPQHAHYAQDLATASGANVRILNDSFEELLARDDLPEFDYISMHGVWTWISDKNRETVLEILKRKLKVGGALQVSYNCQPGWAPILPLVHLMKLHKEATASSTEDIRVIFQRAVEFADTVCKAEPRFFASNPDAKTHLESIKQQNANYLVHEYFHDFWPVFPFSDVAKAMESAKLDYVCPADVFSHLDVFNLPKQHIELINSIGDVVLRETVRDYCMNRRFRSDVFVKGPRSLSLQERDKNLRTFRFVLLRNPNSFDYDKIPLSNGGTVGLNKNTVGPVVDVLAEKDFAPKSFAEIEKHKKLKNHTVAQLAEILVTLTGCDTVATAPKEELLPAIETKCLALNEALLNDANAPEPSGYLVSPYAGQGIASNRIQQYFLLAIKDGKKKPEEWVDFAWKKMSEQNIRVTQNNETIEDEKKNREVLGEQAALFHENGVPLLRAHKII